MRTFLICLSTASLASLLAYGLLAPVANSQAQPSTSANVSRFGMAVVDVSYIFKHHQRFKAKMEAMKKDVDAAETLLKQERQTVGKLQERLELLKPGTPDYKQLDEQIAQAKAAFNVKASQQRKQFLDREARTYYDTYLEVSDAVKYYAQRHNIGLVVRFNGDNPDPGRRELVLQLINRPVVYQGAIDITPDVLQDLNRSAAAPSPTRGANNIQIPGRRPQR